MDLKYKIVQPMNFSFLIIILLIAFFVLKYSKDTTNYYAKLLIKEETESIAKKSEYQLQYFQTSFEFLANTPLIQQYFDLQHLIEQPYITPAEKNSYIQSLNDLSSDVEKVIDQNQTSYKLNFNIFFQNSSNTADIFHQVNTGTTDINLNNHPNLSTSIKSVYSSYYLNYPNKEQTSLIGPSILINYTRYIPLIIPIYNFQSNDFMGFVSILIPTTELKKLHDFVFFGKNNTGYSFIVENNSNTAANKNLLYFPDEYDANFQTLTDFAFQDSESDLYNQLSAEGLDKLTQTSQDTQQTQENSTQMDHLKFLYFTQFKQKKLLYFSAVANPSQPDETLWYIGTIINENDVFFNQKRIILFFMAATAVGSALIFIISFALSFYISKDINKIINVLKAVESGDLTKRIKMKRKDEIRTISDTLNNYLYTLQKTMISINSASLSVQESSTSLSENSQKISQTTHLAFENVKVTHSEITEQNANVNKTAGAVDILGASLKSLENSRDQQSSSVEESSGAIEEMINSIQSVEKTTQKAKNNVDSLREDADSGKDKQDKVISQIKAIAKRSEQLQETNNLIANIANQTNLLSMNAAIEASHAGEAGKGFSVVAEEIRELSEQVSIQSNQVSEVIYEIKQAIDKSVGIADEAGESFTNMNEQVKTVAQIIDEISYSMKEQSEGSKEILNALSQMRDITYDVSNRSHEMIEGNDKITHNIETLQHITENVTNASLIVEKSVMEIEKNTNTSKELNEDNLSKVENIINLLNQFKLK